MISCPPLENLFILTSMPLQSCHIRQSDRHTFPYGKRLLLKQLPIDLIDLDPDSLIFLSTFTLSSAQSFA